MDKLWAPWRIKYIQSRKEKGCIFCKGLKKNKDLIMSNPYAFAILNKFPYNNGHVMIAPTRHIGDISRLNSDEIIAIFAILNAIKARLEKVLRPDGFNIGINISKSAGAGIEGHLHIHIVPRWQADTNFMPVISGTKVISQSLGELQKKLKHAQSRRNKRIRR